MCGASTAPFRSVQMADEQPGAAAGHASSDSEAGGVVDTAPADTTLPAAVPAPDHASNGDGSAASAPDADAAPVADVGSAAPDDDAQRIQPATAAVPAAKATAPPAGHGPQDDQPQHAATGASGSADSGGSAAALPPTPPAASRAPAPGATPTGGDVTARGVCNGQSVASVAKLRRGSDADAAASLPPTPGGAARRSLHIRNPDDVGTKDGSVSANAAMTPMTRITDMSPGPLLDATATPVVRSACPPCTRHGTPQQLTPTFCVFNRLRLLRVKRSVMPRPRLRLLHENRSRLGVEGLARTLRCPELTSCSAGCWVRVHMPGCVTRLKESGVSGRNRGDYAFVVAIQVLHCRMKRTKKDYAIKVMLISFIQKEQKVPFVLTEKRIQSELSHPNIVKLTYAFKDPQYLFMVMELCAAELLGVIWCAVCYDRVDAPRSCHIMSAWSTAHTETNLWPRGSRTRAWNSKRRGGMSHRLWLR